MKHMVMAVLGTMILAAVCVADERREGPQEITDRVSYSVGYQVGQDFRRQGLDINPEVVVKGMQDAMSGGEPQVPPHEMRETLVDLKKRIVAAEQERARNRAETNLAEGKAFLEANAKKEGVVTLPSGLQYKVIKEGSGASPKATDTVTVHYRGTFIDGSEFDSSHGRGEPATFRADRVIKGWQEALQLMKEGATWQLFIPPDLAYGERASNRIGPNSTLVFEVDLISVEKEEGE
jgi:FKBP-type peptidyl-prolyl cis-trans isomerase FklB